MSGLPLTKEGRHDVGMGIRLDGVTWPLRTNRFTIRRATGEDLAATWRFRQRDDVSRWLTRAPATLTDYRTRFVDPASLSPRPSSSN